MGGNRNGTDTDGVVREFRNATVDGTAATTADVWGVEETDMLRRREGWRRSAATTDVMTNKMGRLTV